NSPRRAPPPAVFLAEGADCLIRARLAITPSTSSVEIIILAVLAQRDPTRGRGHFALQARLDYPSWHGRGRCPTCPEPPSPPPPRMVAGRASSMIRVGAFACNLEASLLGELLVFLRERSVCP